MMSKLSVERFNRTTEAGDINPRDALETALSELEQQDVRSVIIVAIDADGDHITYFAGPHVKTIRKLWTVLQYELLRVVERMR